MVESEKVSGSHRKNVVLAGSGARRKSLERLAGELGKRGLQVRIACGIERSMVGLLQASFRYREEAVYLVCGGLEIPEPMLQRIVVAIRSNGVPAERIWSGTLDWADESSLLQQAEHRLAALGLEVGLDDTSAPIQLAATPAQPSSAATVPPPIPLRPNRQTLIAPTTPTPLHLQQPRGSRTPSVNVPIVGTGTEQGNSAPPPTVSNGFFGSTMGKSVSIAAAVLAIGGIAWAVAAGGDSPDEPSGATNSDAPAVAAAQLAGPQEASEETPEPANVADESPTPKAAQPAEVQLEAEAPAAATPEAQPEPLVEPEPEVELEPAVVPTPDPGSPEDRQLIDVALEAQSIRALDILLVAPTATKPRRRRRVVARMRFDDAKTYCEDLSVDGIGSWRLPEVGEAGWLSRANIIREGVFWTSTKADAYGNDHVVWNARAKRMGSTSSRWKGGRVVCVR